MGEKSGRKEAGGFGADTSVTYDGRWGRLGARAACSSRIDACSARTHRWSPSETPWPARTTGANESRELARRLAREFGAPVGLVDPVQGAWLARVGTAAERFPAMDKNLIAALTSSGVGKGRATIWRRDHDGGPIWLVLPVPRLDGGDVIALAGFAPAMPTPEATPGGRCAPMPALQGLGAVGGRQAPECRGREPRRSAAPTASKAASALLIARLIRRLKISDPPERFQAPGRERPSRRPGRRGGRLGPQPSLRARDRQRRGRRA